MPPPIAIQLFPKGALLRMLPLACIPLLSGCFEVSNARGQVQALAKEQQQLVQDIAIYDQHIEYYRSIIPSATTIVGSKDPQFDYLSTYLKKAEEDLADLKGRLATSDAYLKTLREETARTRELQAVR